MTDQGVLPSSEAPLRVLLGSVLERLDDIGLHLHSLELREFPGFSENLSRKRAGGLWASLSFFMVTEPSSPLPPANAEPPSSVQSVEPLPSTLSGSADRHISFGAPLIVQDDLSAPFGPDDARAGHDFSPGLPLGLNGSVVFPSSLSYGPEPVEVDHQATIS